MVDQLTIVQLANFYSPTSGGLRTVLRALAATYLAEGHEVVRIVPGERTEWIDDGGVRELRIRSPRPSFLGGYRVVVARRAVRRVLSEVRPDVIELSDKFTLVGAAAWARRRCGSAVVLVSHERLAGILRSRVPKWFPLQSAARWWNQRIASRVDVVVAPSHYAACEFDGLAPVSVVPWGVDLSVFRPSTAAPLSRPNYRIAMVGRLSGEKRPTVAIEMLREMRRQGVDVELVVVGDGPDRTKLEASAIGLPVRWMGHVSNRADIASALGDAELCLAPCDVETFGLAALEALACGTPVLAAAGGALGELVGGLGAVVEVDAHSRKWAAAAISVLSGDRAVMRGLCRERAEGFSWDAAGTAMLGHFRAVVRTRDARPMIVPWQLAGPWFEV